MASTGEALETKTTDTQETQQQLEPQLPITAKDAVDGPEETTVAKEEPKQKVVLTANGHYVEESTAIWDHDDNQYIDGPESQPINPQDLGNYTPGAPIKEEQLPPTINSDIVSTSDGGHEQRKKTSFNPENQEYEKTQPDSSASATTEEVVTQQPEQKQYYGENPDNLKKKVDSTAEYMTGDDREKYEKFQENRSGASEKPNIMDPKAAKSTNSITEESEKAQEYADYKQQQQTKTQKQNDSTIEEVVTQQPEQKQYYGENPDNLKKKVDSAAEYMAGDDREKYEKFQENKSGASEKPDVMTAESTNSITDESEVTQRYNEQKPQVETPAETEEEPLAQTNTSEEPGLDKEVANQGYVPEEESPGEEESVTPIDAEDVSEDQASAGEVTSPIEPEEATEEIPVEKADVIVEQEEGEVKLNSKELVDLIHAISELNTSVVELKKAFEGNDAVLNSIEKLSITVNNFGTQVINNDGVVLIGQVKAESIEEPADTEVQDDDFEDISEETSVQDLENQKETLEEKLNEPDITEEQKNALNTTIQQTDHIIDLSTNGSANVELTEEDRESQYTESREAAEDFLGYELPYEENQEYTEAGESDEGFLAQIKRVFKGSGWKKFVTEGAKRFGSNLAISSAVGGTVALLGPVGATVVGGAMVAMGGVTLYKGVKMVKEEAKASGRTVKEVWQDKDFRRGVLHGTVTSGVGRLTTMAVSGLVPGVGGFLGASIPALTSAAIGTGLEHGVEFFAERDFKKKEKDFMEKLSSNYNYRNYRMMTDEGYLLDGTEIQGTKSINVKGIAENLRNVDSIRDNQRANFAIKSGVATLLELYNQTQDDRYRYIEYSEEQYGYDGYSGEGYNNQDSYGGGYNEPNTQRLDLTRIGLQDVQGESTDEYPLLEFEPSIDRYIDRIDVQQLADKIEAGWSTIESNEVENVGLRIIQNIAGLEATEVDTVLSEEKKLYYEKVRYMSGWRMGTCVVNAASAIGAGVTIFGQGVAAGRENRSNRQVASQEMETEIEQTRTAIDDNDASVEIMQTENGDKVYAIDLDNDSVVDMYRTETGEIYSTSIVGAEKSFEITNGLSESDAYVTPLPNSQTGIAGTIVDNNTGEVLGVTVDGGNGTWTTMSVNELEAPLSATVAGSNQSTNINISNVQPNGIATVNIDGNSFETNLASLNDIPAIAGTEGVPGAGAVDIEPGDSMPVILRKALVDASQSNENLAEAYANDPYAMERRLYQGNYLENDATIRNEANLTNPLKVENNDGVFEYKDSNLVMEYLQELNGGQPVNLPGGVPATPGQPGYKLGFNANVNNPTFNNLSPIQIDTPDVVTDIPAIPALGSIAALGLGNLFDREPHVMTRETTVQEADPQYYEPGYYGPSYGVEYSESDGTTPYQVEYNPDSPLFGRTVSQVENNSSYVNIKVKSAFSDIFQRPPRQGYNRNGWRDRREVKNDATPAYIKRSQNSEQILEQYLDKQKDMFPEYREAVSEIASKIKPIDNECQVSIAIPALGEEASMQKTLEQFAKLESPEKFEVCILDTFPINSQDKTEEIVKEFSKNNPSINIVYIKREVEQNTNVGESRKFLSDIILERVSRIHDQDQRDNYVVVSQDADLQVFENNDYIDRILNHFERNEDSEVLRGRSNLAREALVEAPIVLAAWRAFNTFDLITTRETQSVQKTLGTNTAIKATTLAGIGGYNPFLKLAEDLDIGWKVRILRDNEATKYSPGIGLQGEARRALIAKLNNVPLVNMYNNFHQNHDVRNKGWEQIIQENPQKFEFNKNDFEKELTALYKHAKSLPTIRNSYNTIFSKTMYALGVQYHIENNDEVKIDRLNKDITDVIEKEKSISDQEQQ